MGSRGVVPDGQRAAHLGAASGILYVVLLVLAEPLPDAIGIRVELVGLVLFLPFLAYLTSILWTVPSAAWLAVTALAAGIANTAVKVASAAPALVARDEPEESELAQALVAVNDASFVLTMYPLAVLVAAAALAILLTGVLPAWLGWAAGVTALALLVNAMFVGAEFGPAFLLFLAWTLAAAIVLFLRARRRAVPA